MTGWVATPGPARAELRERVDYVSYPVAVGPDESLATALSRATPVRPRWWQRFHGRASWNVTWTYRQQIDNDGRCRAGDVVVEVVTEITLPELVQASDAQRRVFGAYLDALRTHEQGHHAIAVQAAQQVHEAIQATGTWADCTALDAQVGRLADQAIAGARLAEQRYDAETGYGRTQGARLDH